MLHARAHTWTFSILAHLTLNHTTCNMPHPQQQASRLNNNDSEVSSHILTQRDKKLWPYYKIVSIGQVIGCEDRLRNDLYIIGLGVKLYSLTHPYYKTSFTACRFFIRVKLV